MLHVYPEKHELVTNVAEKLTRKEEDVWTVWHRWMVLIGTFSSIKGNWR